MNIRDAQRKASLKMLLGAGIAILSLISTVISTLLMFSSKLDDGSAIGSAIAYQLKRFAYFCYEHTGGLHWLWDLAPIPDPYWLTSPSNFWFIAVYLGIFVGSALFSSGAASKARIRRINREIEDQLIKESIAGTRSRTRAQIEQSVDIPGSSIWKQWHELYLAPLVTTIVGALILKFVFGV
ncbi:hypothetical protein HU762_18480 [Pseudomonas sp. SWRI92]|uniref:YniB family protein n=1 Tax=Pseudomonas sp. SWRI92 TaxID=2745499 RepID=UPI001645C004|nr:YniB family protein [Pseudomonas sp. SWRI92]MBC3375939.1 hypothetical protein [Pseudomonas sp. SWRI92]